ncbi:hypothetical protein AVEN_91923-1, partial [Araneus ventricosus]
LKVLPPLGQCLYHFIVPNKSRLPHAGGGDSLAAGPLPALHPSWVGLASVGIFAPHQREDVWPLRLISSATDPKHGSSSVEPGFRPETLRPRGWDFTASPPRPHLFKGMELC